MLLLLFLIAVGLALCFMVVLSMLEMREMKETLKTWMAVADVSTTRANNPEPASLWYQQPYERYDVSTTIETAVKSDAEHVVTMDKSGVVTVTPVKKDKKTTKAKAKKAVK